jgi:UDP:flavonoid glycosyltransferase YjiC (YdhE family)
VLFVTLPEKGHLHPLLGPARALERAGHEVAWYAPRDVSTALARAGFARAYAGAPAPPSDDDRGEELARLVRDRERLRRWIKALLVDAVDEQVPRLEAVVREFRPRVIAADPMAYQAPIAAARAGLPWVALSTSLNPVVPDDFASELIATNAWLAEERDALFRRFGCAARFRVCDCLSPHATVAFTTEALVGAPPDGVTLAGPSLDPSRGDEPEFPWERLDGRPLVYVSLGSQIYWQPRIFERAIAAARGRGVQLVIAAGELAGALDAGDGAIVVRYAPQLALLERARAMITHGGANSVMEALAHGVPLLVAPICNDQPHNARFVERSGAGVALELDGGASPDEWSRTLERLLAPDGKAHAAAARIAASYRARDGATGAAALIERVA